MKISAVLFCTKNEKRTDVISRKHGINSSYPCWYINCEVVCGYLFQATSFGAFILYRERKKTMSHDKIVNPIDDEVLTNNFPVSIVMQHRLIENNIWQAEQWEVEAVVAGGNETTGDIPERSVSRIGSIEEKYIWVNYQINLFADEAESYYFNIISDTPFVFVVCRDEEGDGELIPFSVSVNYDEAASYMELDDHVFQVPMPAEIYRWVEAFVVNNYVPVKKKKRKLENWKDNQQKPNYELNKVIH